MNWLMKYGVKLGTILTAISALTQMAGWLRMPFLTPLLALATVLVAFWPPPKVNTTDTTKK